MQKGSKDHRARVTKLLIRKSFTELLSKKPIQNITIKELCESAGINRGTFYSHYTDIYDLMNKIQDEMLDGFMKALEPLLSQKGKLSNPIEISTEIFQCLKDNSDLCTVTLGEFGDKEFALKLLGIGREMTMESYAYYFKDASPKQIAYFYAFVSEGCIGLLRKWLEDGLAASASEIAKMAEDIMLYGLGFLKK